MKKLAQIVLAALPLVFGSVLPSAALERANAVALTNAFYAAIAPGKDAASMQSAAEKLLADDAVFDLQDLGVMQTRAEFIESLDGWSEAIDGGFLAHIVEGVFGDTVSVRVCYSFGEDQLMNREIFVFNSTLIAKSTQVKIADNCDAF